MAVSGRWPPGRTMLGSEKPHARKEQQQDGHHDLEANAGQPLSSLLATLRIAGGHSSPSPPSTASATALMMRPPRRCHPRSCRWPHTTIRPNSRTGAQDVSATPLSSAKLQPKGRPRSESNRVHVAPAGWTSRPPGSWGPYARDGVPATQSQPLFDLTKGSFVEQLSLGGATQLVDQSFKLRHHVRDDNAPFRCRARTSAAKACAATGSRPLNGSSRSTPWANPRAARWTGAGACPGSGCQAVRRRLRNPPGRASVRWSSSACVASCVRASTTVERPCQRTCSGMWPTKVRKPCRSTLHRQICSSHPIDGRIPAINPAASFSPHRWVQ